MNICITKRASLDKTVTIEAFGLALSVTDTLYDCPITISEDNGNITVSIGTKDICPDDSRAITEDAVPEQDEQELFKSLSALRKKIAEETKMPPYVIFHDNTLKEMCRALPTDLETLGTLQGVGKTKLDKYGEVFITAIRHHVGDIS